MNAWLWRAASACSAAAVSIACLLFVVAQASFPKTGTSCFHSIALRRFSQLRYSLELVQTLKREPRLAPWFDWRLDCRSPAPEGIYRIILPEAAVGSDTPPGDECAKLDDTRPVKTVIQNQSRKRKVIQNQSRKRRLRNRKLNIELTDNEIEKMNDSEID